MSEIYREFDEIRRRLGSRIIDIVAVMEYHLHQNVGGIAVAASSNDILDAPGVVGMARGGNFKVVRMNLQNSGKANAKEPMPAEQRKLRKRKNKKKRR